MTSKSFIIIGEKKMGMILFPGLDATKTARRVEFIDGLIDIMTAHKIYKGLPYTITEEAFVSKIQIPLRDGLADLFAKEYPRNSAKWCEDTAEKALICEKDTTVTVNNTVFFGTQHRPDMYIRENNYRIALEYKIVKTGDMIRAALGQCLVYSSDYDFVVCLLLDVTKDGKIRRAFLKGEKEKRLLKELWNRFGVKVIVVEPNM